MNEKEEILVQLLIEVEGAISVSHPILAAYIREQLSVFGYWLSE